MRGILLCFIFLSLPAQSQNFVGFDGYCGLPVIETSLKQGAIAYMDLQGNPSILIDPGILRDWNTEFTNFSLAHECAHHQLEHSTVEGRLERLVYPTVTVEQEFDADCEAGKLISANFGNDYLRQALRKLGRDFPGTNGYPSGHERVKNVVRCLVDAGLFVPKRRR